MGGGTFSVWSKTEFKKQLGLEKIDMAAFQYDFFQLLFISLKHDKKTQFSQINFNPIRRCDVLQTCFFAQKMHLVMDGAAFLQG
jgi:hypothetical protein